MASLDTDAASASLHEASYRELGLSGRFKIALELSDLTHALAMSNMRRHHPEWSDEDAYRRLAELYGSAQGSAGECSVSSS